MPITYTFQQDDCPSFGGASLSNARIPTILAMDDYVRSRNDENITGRDIQINIEHDEGDTRSIISVMRKLNFINLPERSGISASHFYTNFGDAYIHILRALQELEKLQDLLSVAYNATLRSLQLILQEGIWYHYNTTEKTRLGIYVVLNLIGKTKTLSFNEYCFALSESIINGGYFDFESITKAILMNRENNIVYTFRKKRLSNERGNLGERIESEVEDFNSVLQCTREILQQAGILEEDTTDCILRDSSFLIKHNLPYE